MPTTFKSLWATVPFQTSPKLHVHSPSIPNFPQTPHMEFLLHWISNASVLAFLIILPTFLLPPQLYQSLNRFFLRLFPAAAASHSITTFTIYEFDAFNNRERYDFVHSYLVPKCLPSGPIIKFSKPKNSNNLTFTIDSDQVMEDTFDGMRVKWLLRTSEKKHKIFGCVYRYRKIRSFELSFHNKHSTKVHSRCLPTSCKRLLESTA